MEGFRKLQQLRVDFDQARTLLKLVRRRERCKRVLVDVLDEVRKQTIYELTDKSGKIRKPKVWKLWHNWFYSLMVRVRSQRKKTEKRNAKRRRKSSRKCAKSQRTVPLTKIGCKMAKWRPLKWGWWPYLPLWNTNR